MRSILTFLLLCVLTGPVVIAESTKSGFIEHLPYEHDTPNRLFAPKGSWQDEDWVQPGLVR